MSHVISGIPEREGPIGGQNNIWVDNWGTVIYDLSCRKSRKNNVDA